MRPGSRPRPAGRLAGEAGWRPRPAGCALLRACLGGPGVARSPTLLKAHLEGTAGLPRDLVVPPVLLEMAPHLRGNKV